MKTRLTLPKIVCETCTHCKGYTVGLLGHIEIHCCLNGYTFNHILPRAKCEEYECDTMEEEE